MSPLQRFLKFFQDPFRTAEDPSARPPDTAALPSYPDIPSAARRISLVAELRGKLSDECHAYGFETARISGRRAPDASALKAIDALAEARARGMADAISQNALDKLVRDLKEWETMLEQRVLDRDGAANKLHLARQSLAALPEPGDYPAISPLTLHGSTLWLAASLAPTCHDLIAGLDPQMRWLAGIGGAYAISVAIVNGILPETQPDPGAPVKGSCYHSAMIAGVLLGVAFFGLRIAGARSNGDMMLAGALALMELGAVVLVERKAKPLFGEIDTWRERASARRIGAAGLAGAQQELDRRENLVSAAGHSIAGIEDAIERAHAVADVKTLIGVATSAMRGGYARGIAENAADLGGAA